MTKTYRPGSNGRKCTAEPRRSGNSVRMADRIKGRKKKALKPEIAPGVRLNTPGKNKMPCREVQVKQSARMRRAFAADCKENGWIATPTGNLGNEAPEYTDSGIFRPQHDFYIITPKGKEGVAAILFLEQEGAIWCLSCLPCIDTAPPPSMGVGGGEKLPPSKRRDTVVVTETVSRKGDVRQQRLKVDGRTYVVVAPSAEPAKGSLDVQRQRTNGQFAPSEADKLTPAPNPTKHVFLSEAEKKTAREAEEVRRGLPVRM